MIRIAHVINGLGPGGAEMMLMKLIEHGDRDAFAAHVCSLTDQFGQPGERLQALGVEVERLDLPRHWPNPFSIFRISRWLRRLAPDVVQTWMYHSDLAGGIASKLAGRNTPVVWGIQNGTFDEAATRRRTVYTAQACARMSGWLPHTIICCGEVSRRLHASMGYDEDKLTVIPNGIDMTTFRPDPDSYSSVREELGLAADTIIVGLIARFDPQKDHRTFVMAAARLHAQRPDVHFLLCGRHVVLETPELKQLVEAAGIAGVCHLLGVRRDVPRITSALDIATLSSAYGESFPNVLGEAMACGVPCVATDVGDSAQIIGDTGLSVPTRDAAALADAWETLLAQGPGALRERGQRARARVEQHYDIDGVVRSYESTYMAAVAASHARRRRNGTSSPRSSSSDGARHSE